MANPWFLRLNLSVVLAGSLAGCGSGAAPSQFERHAVSGTVTFDGKPLESGSIQISPLDPGKKGTVSGGLVQAGVFRISEANGLPPGKYRVAISSTPPAAADPAAAMKPVQDGKPVPDPIPARYNSNSELTCEIKSGGATELAPFELKSGK